MRYSLSKAYNQTNAEKYQSEKRLIVAELNKNGIYSTLTQPEELTANTINHYTCLKLHDLSGKFYSVEDSPTGLSPSTSIFGSIVSSSGPIISL